MYGTDLRADPWVGPYTDHLRVRFQSPTVNHPWYVFLQRIEGDPNRQILRFVDMLSGEERPVEVQGERFTLFGDSVLYFDRSVQRVMVATVDGTLREHPFMQMEIGARRIDWVVTRTGKRLAWTLTFADNQGLLSTRTQVAESDGSSLRTVLVDGPRDDGLRAMPVAFDTDPSRLFMDYQPDGLTDLTPFPQYAALFALDIDAGAPDLLPEEPGDFTGAGFGAGFYLRLALTEDLSGFDLRVFNLDNQLDWFIPALRLRGFTQAGDILVAPDGRYAVYALSEISGFGTERQSVETVFLLVDLIDMTQNNLTASINSFVRPVAWTEDNSAIIFTSPQRDGTWKISLADGRLEKIAEPSYLGLLQPAY